MATCARLFGKHVANGSLTFTLKHRLKATVHPPMFPYTSIHFMRCNPKKDHDTSKCLASCSLPMISSRQCYDSPKSLWCFYASSLLPGLTMGLDQLKKLQKRRGLWKLRVDRVKRSSTPWHVLGSFTLPSHDLLMLGNIGGQFQYSYIQWPCTEIWKQHCQSFIWRIFFKHSDTDRSWFCWTTQPLCRSPFAGRWETTHIFSVLNSDFGKIQHGLIKVYYPFQKINLNLVTLPSVFRSIITGHCGDLLLQWRGSTILFGDFTVWSVPRTSTCIPHNIEIIESKVIWNEINW